MVRWGEKGKRKRGDHDKSKLISESIRVNKKKWKNFDKQFDEISIQKNIHLKFFNEGGNLIESKLPDEFFLPVVRKWSEKWEITGKKKKNGINFLFFV